MDAERSGAPTPRDAEALDWVRRLDDPEFVDWDAHLAWLEKDPANAAALDRMSLLVEDAADGLARRDAGPVRDALEVPGLPASANDNHPAGGDRAPLRWWPAGLVAVAATALAVVATTLGGGPREEVVRTRPGEHRTL